MASGNRVVLTFAGESRDLEQTFDRVGSSSRRMGREADSSGDHLERLGETGGTTETRFLGLGAGISGVSTLLSGDAGPEDYAMAMADLGDAVEHTVAPLLAQGRQLVANGVMALRSAGQHAVAAATTVAGWVASGAAALVAGAQMALAWLIGLGPVVLVIAAIAAVIGILALLGVGFDDIKNVALAAWNFIWGLIQTVFNWIAANWPLILAILTGPIGLAVLFITRNWDTIKNGFTAVKDWIFARVGDIVGFITGIPGRIAGVASTMFNAVGDAATGVKNWISDRVDDIVSFFSDLPGRVASAFSGFGTAIVNGVKSVWNSTIGGFGFDVPSWVPGVGGRSFRIPELHSGGVVPGAPGAEVLALLQAGERVTPAGAAGPAVVVNLNVAGSIVSERDLIRLVRDEIINGGFA